MIDTLLSTRITASAEMPRLLSTQPATEWYSIVYRYGDINAKALPVKKVNEEVCEKVSLCFGMGVGEQVNMVCPTSSIFLEIFAEQ